MVEHRTMLSTVLIMFNIMMMMMYPNVVLAFGTFVRCQNKDKVTISSHCRLNEVFGFSELCQRRRRTIRNSLKRSSSSQKSSYWPSSALCLSSQSIENANDTTTESVTISSSEAPVSPNEALDYFLSTCASLDSIEIISRGSSKIKKLDTISIKSLVFESSHHVSPIVVVLSDKDLVDEDGKLRKAVCQLPKDKMKTPISKEETETFDASNNAVKVELAPSDRVQALCGFSPGSIPPLGHFCVTIPSSSTMLDKGEAPKSKNSKTRVNHLPILVDQNLINRVKNEKKPTLLLGGGGHPYWQCLLSIDTLLELDHVYPTDVAVEVGHHKMKKNKEQASSSLSYEDYGMVQRPPKPFFPVPPPPIHIAQTVMDQRDLSNPLTPSWVTVVGRVGKVRRMAKKLAFADLLPLPTWSNADNKKNKRRRQGEFDSFEETKSDIAEDEQQWRSGIDGIGMAVQLIVGKTICQQLGSARGEQAIKDLKEGQVLLINGKTNVGNRESLSNWVTKRSLDLVVFEYQVLISEDGSVDTMNKIGGIGLEGKQRDQPTKHKPRSSGLPSASQSGEACLTLHDLYPNINKTPPYPNTESNTSSSSAISMVNDLNSVLAFTNDYSEFSRSLQTITEGNEVDEMADVGARSLAQAVVGIDCEWKPQVFMTSPEPQPILLLQISLHSLQRLYLLDMMNLVRPLLSPEEPMNELETAVNDVLIQLFSSNTVIKTGYQISEDLRRMAASYPHIPAFQEIHSTLEVSTLVKRVLHITKQKKSRSITQSLSRLVEHFIGKPLDKDNQVSDWSIRPLTPQQLAYAALDAAISPVLVEKVLMSINARIVNRNGDFPIIERHAGDTGLAKGIESWRFLFLETEDSNAIRKLRAQRLVGGSEWLVTQHWITGHEHPQLPSVPTRRDGKEGPYVDESGALRIPPRMISLRRSPSDKNKDEDDNFFETIVGQRAGRSKDKCLGLLLNNYAKTLPDGARVDFPQRSGYVEFQDGVVLFVNSPDSAGLGRPRSYPNEWLDDGRLLTWFLRTSDWRDGNSELAQKLCGDSNHPDHDTESASAPPLIFLFVRMGSSGNFLCCGRCRAQRLKTDCTDREKRDWDLIQLNLELLDYDVLASSCDNFIDLVRV